MNRKSHYERREGEEVKKEIRERRGRKIGGESEGEGKTELGERSEGGRTESKLTHTLLSHTHTR